MTKGYTNISGGLRLAIASFARRLHFSAGQNFIIGQDFIVDLMVWADTYEDLAYCEIYLKGQNPEFFVKEKARILKKKLPYEIHFFDGNYEKFKKECIKIINEEI